jgi:glycine betaine/proline transport system ATP-binding protein
MQQRVGLARALVMEPEILLMDEPFSGLDPLIRREMQDELIRIQRDLRKTIVFITHDLSEAVKLGDRVAIMRDGVIVQIGSPEDIILSPEGEYVEQFTRDVRREAVLTTARVMARPGTVVLDYQSPAAALHAMQSNDANVTAVVDALGHYLGMLTLEQATAADRAGEERVGSRLTSQVPTASPEMPLDELIPLSLATDELIPVVDNEGKLVGEVSRVALAGTISGNRNGGTAAHVNNGGVQGHDPNERSLLPSLSGVEEGGPND